mmetsp:Transcript_108572/g.306072  ORF Transcript_108572/g.306072 Transcript_108572/m.306072 type:complete len:238 (+) Transcript_108572:708-1421(+)
MASKHKRWNPSIVRQASDRSASVTSYMLGAIAARFSESEQVSRMKGRRNASAADGRFLLTGSTNARIKLRAWGDSRGQARAPLLIWPCPANRITSFSVAAASGHRRAKLKGLWPTRSKYAIMPTLHMSLLPKGAGSVRHSMPFTGGFSSGGAYHKDPTPSAGTNGCLTFGLYRLAQPKSVSLRHGIGQSDGPYNKRFSGLTSLCSTEHSTMCCNAESNCTSIFATKASNMPHPLFAA